MCPCARISWTDVSEGQGDVTLGAWRVWHTAGAFPAMLEWARCSQVRPRPGGFLGAEVALPLPLAPAGLSEQSGGSQHSSPQSVCCVVLLSVDVDVYLNTLRSCPRSVDIYGALVWALGSVIRLDELGCVAEATRSSLLSAVKIKDCFLLAFGVVLGQRASPPVSLAWAQLGAAVAGGRESWRALQPPSGRGRVAFTHDPHTDVPWMCLASERGGAVLL